MKAFRWNTAAHYNGETLLPLGSRSTNAVCVPGNLLYLLNNASLLVLLVAFGAGALRWRQLNSEFRVLVVAMGSILLIGLCQLVLWLQSIPNLPLLHLYTVAEFVLLGSFFRLLAPPQSVVRTAITSLVVVGTLLMLANSVWLQDLNQFNSHARTLESLLLTGFAIHRLFTAASTTTSGPREKALFWINAGILLYFSASLIVFLFSNYTSGLSKDMSRNIWSIHALFNLLFNCLLAVGIFKLWQPPTSTFSD